MWCGIFITFALWMYYLYRIDYQVQGRYILPALPALYVYVCAGYERLTSRLFKGRAQTAMVSLAIAFIVLALYHYVFVLCRSVYRGIA